ncbi:MAG: protein kinase [Planctomycetaceae bacterium]
MTRDAQSGEIGVRLLSEIAAERRLPELFVLNILTGVTQKLVEVHNSGRFYGKLTATAVLIDEASSVVSLIQSDTTILIGGSDDADQTPLWFRTAEPIELKRQVNLAQPVLDEAGIPQPAQQIDLYQIGTLACRLLTGEGIIEYLRSPKVKGEISPPLQRIIDASLGFDAECRFSSAGELLAELNKLIDLQFAEPDTAVSGVGIDAERDTSLMAESSKRTGNAEDLPWSRLGHYEITGRIGRGGMGDVYQGFERSLNRIVAIKVLPQDLAQQPEFVRRFYAEASAAARIVHPNVIPIHFIGEDKGCHFFAMQYVEGESLAELVARHPQMSVEQTLDLIEPVLSGLAAAHQHGLIHRDIKPGNILLDRVHKRTVLADFGLVKSLQDGQEKTATGVVMGTVDYISPEQGRGRAVDHRSDLYSVGVLLYQLLCGKLPFTAESATALIFQHVYEAPPSLRDVNPAVSESLAAVVAKLMAKSPEDRHASANAVLEDLRATRTGQPLPSGADVLLQSNPQAFNCLKDRRGAPETNVILAPQFSDEPWLLDEIPEEPPLNWWQKLKAELGLVAQNYAPELVQRLANTQQQVDLAVDNYLERQRRLRGLVEEAELVLNQLRTEEANWKKASKEADDSAHRAVTELGKAIVAQSNQLDSMRLDLAKIEATVETFEAQRNLLNARLRKANANRPQPNSSRVLPTSVVVTLVGVFVLAVIAVLFRVSGRDAVVSNSSSSDPSTESPAELVPTDNAASASESHDWPIADPKEVTIPLPANVRAMDIEVLRYGITPEYSALILLENGEAFTLYFRDDHEVVHQVPFRNSLENTEAIELSAGKKYVAVADTNHQIRLYTSSVDEYRRLDGSIQMVDDIEFSSDNTRLVAVGRDATVRIWDIQSGAIESVFEVDRTLYADRLVANGPLSRIWTSRVFPLGTQPSTALSLWDVNQASEIQSFKVPGAVTALTPSRDWTELFTHSGTRVDVWNAETGEWNREFASPSQTAAFATLGGRAMTVGENGIEYWQTATGELLDSRPLDEPLLTKQTSVIHKPFPQISLSPDGEIGLIATSTPSLKIVNFSQHASTSDLSHSFAANREGGIYSLDISEDGVWLAGGGEGTIYVWNLKHPPASFTLGSPHRITAVQFSRDGHFLAYGTGDPNSKVNFVGVRFLSDDQRQRFLEKNQDWRKLSGFQGAISSVHWDHSGRKTIASSLEGELRVWDSQEDFVDTEVQLQSPIECLVKFHKQAASLFVDGSNTVALWDDGLSPESEEWATLDNQLVDAAVSVDDQFVAIARRDGQIAILDAESRVPVATLETRFDPVSDLCFIAREKRLVSGHTGGVVRVWNIDSGTVLKDYVLDGSPVSAVDVTPDGRHVVAAMSSGNVAVWKLP